MKKAFSLIELLISLITISVILASLAPVVTHKLKHGGVSIGTKKLSMKCPNTVGADCTLCLGNQCIACPISCGNQFKNTLTCKCESCTQSNCGNCNSDRNKCDRCNDGYGLNSNGSCGACNAPYVSNGGSSGCIKCDTGYKYQNENLKTQCKECDTANGYFPNSDRLGCTQKTCSKGYKRSGSTCVACTGDTYQPNDNYSGTSCSNCGTNSVANANHTGCNSTCVDKSTCTGNNYHDGCQCKPCGANTTPNTDRTACDAAAPSTPSGPTSCPEGQYLSGSTCTACPTGCKKCTSATSCQECIVIDVYNVKDSETRHSQEYKLVGETCKKIKRPKSQDDCDKSTDNSSIYIPFINSNCYGGGTCDSLEGYGFCVTKFNAGDLNGPTIPTSVETKRAGDSKQSCDAKTQQCCWTGGNGTSGAIKTASTADGGCITDTNATKMYHTSDTSAFNYGGCNRTVCNRSAAQAICRSHSIGKTHVGDWEMFSATQVYAINDRMQEPANKNGTGKGYVGKFTGASGLQICQHGTASNTAGLPKCNESSRCYGAYNNKCYPSLIWGNIYTFGTTAEYSAITADSREYSFYSGLDGTNGKSYALSTRCYMMKFLE